MAVVLRDGGFVKRGQGEDCKQREDLAFHFQME